jgi:hypothetical protein
MNATIHMPCPFAGLTRRATVVALLTLTATACARAQEVSVDPAALEGLPPAGFGTLKQEGVSLRLRTPTLQIQLVPLDERVIRLLATDTYNSMHGLASSKSEDIEEAARRYGIRQPTLFFVTFFGLERQARFDPQVLTITSQNRLFRPVGILPLSPLWSRQQLNQRETATAIYLYEDGIRVLDPFTLEYEGVINAAWEQILRTLEAERASVLARAAAERKP